MLLFLVLLWVCVCEYAIFDVLYCRYSDRLKHIGVEGFCVPDAQIIFLLSRSRMWKKLRNTHIKTSKSRNQSVAICLVYISGIQCKKLRPINDGT